MPHWIQKKPLFLGAFLGICIPLTLHDWYIGLHRNLPLTSVRKGRVPSPTNENPRWLIISTSSAVHPPSGPIANHTSLSTATFSRTSPSSAWEEGGWGGEVAARRVVSMGDPPGWARSNIFLVDVEGVLVFSDTCAQKSPLWWGN